MIMNPLFLLILAVLVVVAFAVIAAGLIKEEINHIKRGRRQREEDTRWLKERDKVSSMDIMEEWADVIEGASGYADEFMDRMAYFLSGRDLPHTKVFKRKLTLGGALPRPFLIAVNEKVRGYRILVGAEKFGEYLNVSWYYAGDPAELALIKLAEQREKDGVLYDHTILMGQRVFKNLTEPKKGWPEWRISFLGRIGGWVTAAQMNMLDQKEMANWAGIILARTQAEAKRLKHKTRKEDEAPLKSGGFIDIL